MAFSVLKIGKPDEGYLVNSDGVYHEFICDAVADVANLPTTSNSNYSKPRAGSTAVIAGTGDVYILNPSRSWVRLIEGDN